MNATARLEAPPATGAASPAWLNRAKPDQPEPDQAPDATEPDQTAEARGMAENLFYVEGLPAVAIVRRMEKAGISPEHINSAIESLEIKPAEFCTPKADVRKLTSPENGKKRQPINYKQLTEKYLACIDGEYAIRWQCGDWFEYRPAEGWRSMAEANLSARVMTWLQARSEKLARGSTVREILANLTGMTMAGIPEDMARPCWIRRDADGMPIAEPARNHVSFAGSVVDVIQAAKGCEGGQLVDVARRKLSEAFWSTDILPFKLADSYEGSMPLFQQLLDDALDMPEQSALQRMFGVCLSDETRWEAFWILCGAAASGKSTLLRVLEALVGEHNVSRVELQMLCERFQSWPITRSKINLTGDMPRLGKGGLGKVEGFFKNVTGQGARIDIEMKNQQQLLNVPVRARFVFAANSLPYLEDKSEGMWRRLRILSFERTCPPEKRDPTLADRIIGREMPAIAAWAIEGLSEVLLLNGVPDSERGEAAKADHRATCDTVRLWLQEAGYNPGGQDDRIPAQELYNQHLTWRQENGHRSIGAHEFYTRVCECMHAVKKLARIGSDRVQAFIGVKQEFVTLVTSPQLVL
ncbi:MAG: hypothetical protein ISS35_02920 [Kiritimatiellae bacterium]|nr:hypothetical protein [Kiritimatiellia bacterium]